MAAPSELVTVSARSGELEAHRVAHLPLLVIHAHSSCNCRCVMCDIWKTTESRTFRVSDLERHLDSIRRFQVRWIVFSGGEPLLNPELPQLCSTLRNESVHLTLLTTGLLLRKQARQVIASFDDIIVSLDGPPPIHDAIRRVDGAFALLQSGVAEIRKLHPAFPITARTTVQKANHTHLRETCAAAKGLGLDGISFLAADLTSEAFNRPSAWTPERQSEVSLSIDELPAIEAEINSLIAESSIDISQGYIAESPQKLKRIVSHFRAHLGLESPTSPVCNAPWTSAVLETDGTVRPCFFHRSIGDARLETLEDVINGRDALAFRSALNISRNPICNRCVCSLNYGS